MVGVRPTVGRVVRTAIRRPTRDIWGALPRVSAHRKIARWLERFQQAIAQDSAYAPAYAGSPPYLPWAFYGYPGITFYEANGR